jgi:branched-chain amino acid aminotransferase
MVRGGRLHTPPASANILEGITRAAIMEIARNELGIGTDIRSIDRSELYQADELFFCGTMAEVVAIGSVDHRPVAGGMPGPVTRQLQECFFEIVRGARPRYAEWLTPVYQSGEEAGGRLVGSACEAHV